MKDNRAFILSEDKAEEFLNKPKNKPRTMIEEASKSIVEIPKGATNGDVIKAMFPNLRVEDNGGSIYLRYPDSGWIVYDRKWWNWWNAPYKKEVEE